MHYAVVPVTAFQQNCSLVWDENSRQGVVIDPGGEADKIHQQVEQRQLKLTHILLTHGHLDHVGAAAELAARYHIPVVGPQRQDQFWLEALPVQSEMFGLAHCAPLQPDQWLEEGDTIVSGALCFQVLHCPGHTPGHVVFYLPEHALLFAGDVLFKGGVGRTDFPKGDHAQLIHAIRSKLLVLGDEVTFIPGHGPSSTLGHERQTNPFLR